MRFADPWFLVLLAVLLWLGWRTWAYRRRPPRDRIGFPALGFLEDTPATRPGRWRWVPDALRVGGLALLILALARPQQPHDVQEIHSKSRNITNEPELVGARWPRAAPE
jgi:Aerotolerance regulator N-terminal